MPSPVAGHGPILVCDQSTSMSIVTAAVVFHVECTGDDRRTPSSPVLQFANRPLGTPACESAPR